MTSETDYLAGVLDEEEEEGEEDQGEQDEEIVFPGKAVGSNKKSLFGMHLNNHAHTWSGPEDEVSTKRRRSSSSSSSSSSSGSRSSTIRKSSMSSPSISWLQSPSPRKKKRKRKRKKQHEEEAKQHNAVVSMLLSLVVRPIGILLHPTTTLVIGVAICILFFLPLHNAYCDNFGEKTTVCRLTGFCAPTFLCNFQRVSHLFQVATVQSRNMSHALLITSKATASELYHITDHITEKLDALEGEKTQAEVAKLNEELIKFQDSSKQLVATYHTTRDKVISSSHATGQAIIQCHQVVSGIASSLTDQGLVDWSEGTSLHKQRENAIVQLQIAQDRIELSKQALILAVTETEVHLELTKLVRNSTAAFARGSKVTLRKIQTHGPGLDTWEVVERTGVAALATATTTLLATGVGAAVGLMGGPLAPVTVPIGTSIGWKIGAGFSSLYFFKGVVTDVTKEREIDSNNQVLLEDIEDMEFPRMLQMHIHQLIEAGESLRGLKDTMARIGMEVQETGEDIIAPHSTFITRWVANSILARLERVYSLNLNAHDILVRELVDLTELQSDDESMDSNPVAKLLLAQSTSPN